MPEKRLQRTREAYLNLGRAALGYGWKCPCCRVAQDEGQATGVYYFSRAVCARCAPVLMAVRRGTSAAYRMTQAQLAKDAKDERL